MTLQKAVPTAALGAPATGARIHLGAVLTLLLGLMLIYGRAGTFGYLDYDDIPYVVRTEPVRAGLSLEGVRWAFTAFHLDNWHPLTWISHMVDVSLFGLAPGPAHVVNVAIHGTNTLLVYVLSLCLLGNALTSLLVAFLFLAHPLHVESVAWIAERKDLLCGMFFLLALIAHVRYARRPSAWRYAGVAFAFVLALLSKPMAITLPIVLLLLDFWPLGRWRRTAVPMLGMQLPAYAGVLLEKLPLLLLSAASGIVTLAAQKAAIVPVGSLSPSYRLANAVVAYAVYLQQTLVPTRLAILYPHVPIDLVAALLPSFAVLAAISILAVAYRHSWPWLLVGWLWFLAMLVPVIGLIQVGPQSHADRYMYLPSLGLFLALAAPLARLSEGAWKKFLLALAPVLAFYSFLAWVQFGYWSGPYMIFARSLEVAGESYQVRAGLAGAYLRVGRLEDAERHALKALAMSPRSPFAYTLVASVLEAKQDYAGAEQFYRAALLRSPGNPEMLNNLGRFLTSQGRREEASHLLEAASKADPDLYKAR